MYYADMYLHNIGKYEFKIWLCTCIAIGIGNSDIRQSLLPYSVEYFRANSNSNFQFPIPIVISIPSFHIVNCEFRNLRQRRENSEEQNFEFE
jgi:hypothetical protein